jgi:hypothetical protein
MTSYADHFNRDKYLNKGPTLAKELKTLFQTIEQLKIGRGDFVRVADAASTTVSTSRKLSGSAPTSDVKLSKRIEDLENVFRRFVPPQFSDLIAPSGMENAVLGDAVSRNISILFSDIRDFTSMTEKMHVHEVIEFLNTYLAFAIPAITEKGGFIDKFIGDAIMAIFPHQGMSSLHVYNLCHFLTLTSPLQTQKNKPRLQSQLQWA